MGGRSVKFLSSFLEALGLVALIVGAAWFDVRLGVMVGGLVLVLLGLVLDPPRREP